MPLNDGAINEIYPFAFEGVESSSVHGDLLPLSTYKSSLERRRGHQIGIAKRATANREARQATHIAAGVAQFIANRYAPGVRDDGDLDKIEEGLVQSLLSIVLQKGGIPKWDREERYDALPYIVWGSDWMLYIALQPSGTAEIGPKDPTNTEEYWQSLPEWILRYINNGGGGGIGSGAGGDSLVYPGAFHSFYEKQPPSGWMVRNGALIANASVNVPLLWESLQQPEYIWKVITENQWQVMSREEPWNGIGGAPYFVLDLTANTIRLPDTRGMYQEDAGFDGLGVGGVHGDAIRNMEGTIGELIHTEYAKGPFYQHAYVNSRNYPGGPYASGIVGFNASRQVPTASVNRPKAFGMLGCVYVGSSTD